MNRKLFRMVRWVSIVFPVLWFIYIFHVVSQGEDDSSLIPREAVEEVYNRGPQKHPVDEVNDIVSKEKFLERPTFPKYKDKADADVEIAKYKNVDIDKALRILDKMPAIPEFDRFRQRLEKGKAAKERLKLLEKERTENDALAKGKVENGGVEKFQRKDVRDAKSDFPDKVLRVPVNKGQPDKDAARLDDSTGAGVKKDAHGVDEFAGVTYPLYVERLPSGANGNTEKGLKIHKDSLPPEKQKEYQEKWDKNNFNQMASDLMPVHRELPDFRTEACRQKEYPLILPTISVIIIFHNEAWSVLLRSVHSILDRTKDELLLEVILVDDFSTMNHLKIPLDKYFRDYPKVKIVRCPERGGLTKARLRGFAASKGEAIVFLDSHIECSPGWAEPLLAVIAEDYRVVPFPVIDLIGAGDFEYGPHRMSFLGTFNLQTLTFTWSGANLHVLNHYNTSANTRPSPTMPGGLFAISRRWFEELGQYDPQLDYWGGENMELSFKAWMCNGSVVVAECSHIGHIFRSNNPIKWATNLGNRNYVRVAKVWMDDYKNHYFERVNYLLGDYGDVSSRVALRKGLGCHDFGWYVDNIYPELKEQIVFKATYAGQIKHADSGQCLDKMANYEHGPQLFSCHSLGGPQFWYLTDDKYLQIETRYLSKGANDTVRLSSTKDEWKYDEPSQHLVHVETGLCLQKSLQSPRKLCLALCSPLSTNQRWIVEKRPPFPEA